MNVKFLLICVISSAIIGTGLSWEWWWLSAYDRNALAIACFTGYFSACVMVASMAFIWSVLKK